MSDDEQCPHYRGHTPADIVLCGQMAVVYGIEVDDNRQPDMSGRQKRMYLGTDLPEDVARYALTRARERHTGVQLMRRLVGPWERVDDE